MIIIGVNFLFNYMFDNDIFRNDFKKYCVSRGVFLEGLGVQMMSRRPAGEDYASTT